MRRAVCTKWGFWLALCLLGSVISVEAADRLPDVLVFHREDCPRCGEMDAVLEELQRLYPRLVVRHIEESERGATDLMWSLSAKFGILPSTYPVILVGEQGIVGVGRAKELLLRNAVRDCMQNGCPSPLAQIEARPFPWTLTVALAAAAVFVLFLLLSL